MNPKSRGPLVWRWAQGSLQRQFALIAGVLMLLASAVFLLVVSQQYKTSILRAHEQASVNVNLLLQATLENAMIKRDLAGLQDIVSRLGQQQGVAGVMIANPAGQVRFSSYPDALYKELGDRSFAQAIQTGEQQTGFRELASGQEVLRSINPVHNQDRCFECHGATTDNPINGLLIVDYDSSDTRGAVWRGALMLAGLGVVVLLLVEAGLWMALNRLVLVRISRLSQNTRAVAAGDLSVRTQTQGHDELALLGANFDDMADQLENNLQELQSAHASLQTLIDAIPDGVRVIGPDYRIVMANKAYCDQLGADPFQIAGQYCYASSHKRDKPCVPTLVQCPIVSILQQGGQDMTSSHEHVDADGAELSVETSAAMVSLLIDGKEQQCVVESIRDMEADLSISQKQRLAEMGSLAAGIAHEVHNPLSSISLALKAIKAQVELPKEMEQYFEIAETEIGNCKAITESLLRLSALPQFERELIDMQEVIHDTASLLSFEAAQFGVEIKCDVVGQPRILARDSDMRNLVFNLSLNAIHAMPNGGEMLISCHASDDSITLKVRDDGVGIPERDQAKILLPFWTRRADGSRGRGLGLAICSSIVKNQGGSLSFESKVGIGTCFTIQLPVNGEALE